MRYAALLLLFRITIASSLRILLTNNNGYDELGLQLLKRTLRDDGHDVFVYAPDQMYSGAAAALNLPTVQVSEVGQQEYTVTGYAATCVLVGISAMSAVDANLVPDLILSGINDGYTSGSQDLHSGTIGGALTGLAKGIPSIAILSDSPNIDDVGAQTVEKYYLSAAKFVTDLVDVFEEDLSEFPKGVGLKVIYPAMNTSYGIMMAEDNSYFFATFDYRVSDTEDNTLVAQVISVDPPKGLSTVVDSDIVQDGFISVLPIHSDISVGQSRYNENFLDLLRYKIENQVPFKQSVGKF